MRGLFFVIGAAAFGAELPDSFVDRVDAVPDVLQTSVQADGARGGVDYCAPAAVANSLMFLGRNGYPAILEGASGEPLDPVALVELLGSAAFMNSRDGTSKEGILRGVAKYAAERGVVIASAEYAGIELYYDPDREPSPPVSIAHLKSAVVQTPCVWLQIGWYTRAEDGAYQKVGGHWVTLVGYEASEDTAGVRMLIHDPSPRSGAEPTTERVSLRPIEEGMVNGLGLPQPAKGCFELDGELRLSDRADTAILEGAVVVEYE